jgi:septal ring factor EnvC (AmiA/AmiB activator)
MKLLRMIRLVNNSDKPVMLWLSLIFIIGFILTDSHPVRAQNKADDLRAKRKKIEKEIEYTNKLLSETRKNKKNTLYELQLIQNKINQRNELIATLKKEISILEKKISRTKNGISNMNNQLENLKKEYARVVVFLARNNGKLDKLIFIFSAEDLNQAYQRLRYLDELTGFIRQQADSIRNMENIKEKELTDLNAQKNRKSKLLENENLQLDKLENNQREKDKLRAGLSKKEKQLRAQLRKKQQEAKKLNKKIENIISSETKVKKSASGKSSYALTPKEKELAKAFFNNKGRLPWPVDRGVISGTFGSHPHPVLKHVMVKNNGIDIATSANSEAKAVFKGKVVSVTTISNTNIAVIIKHGNWFTVYSNLEKVYVTKGDEVTGKEPLGLIHTNLKGKTELHFEVWNGKHKQNPYYWILKK